MVCILSLYVNPQVSDESNRPFALKISWNPNVSTFEYDREVSQLKKLQEEGDSSPPFLLRYEASFRVTSFRDPLPILVTYPFCRMTLEDMVESGNYSMADAMKWGRQICEAMRNLDDRSVLHGDLALR